MLRGPLTFPGLPPDPADRQRILSGQQLPQCRDPLLLPGVSRASSCNTVALSRSLSADTSAGHLKQDPQAGDVALLSGTAATWPAYRCDWGIFLRHFDFS